MPFLPNLHIDCPKSNRGKKREHKSRKPIHESFVTNIGIEKPHFGLDTKIGKEARPLSFFDERICV